MTTSIENITEDYEEELYNDQEEYGNELYNLVKVKSSQTNNEIIDSSDELNKINITTYGLISADHDKKLNQIQINEIDKALEDYDLYMIGEWTDDELIIIMSNGFIENIIEYCERKNIVNPNDKIREEIYLTEKVWYPVFIRLSKLSNKQEYSYFFKMLKYVVPYLEFTDEEDVRYKVNSC